MNLFSSHSDQDVQVPVPTPFGFATTTGRLERNTAGVTLTARYTVVDDLQLVAGLPFFRREQKVRTGDQSLFKSNDDEFGDLGLRARYVVSREQAGAGGDPLGQRRRPDRRLPRLQPRARGVARQEHRPESLFASLDYFHTFDAASRDVEDLQSQDVVNASTGFAFAMNDRLSFSMAVNGSFSQRASSTTSSCRASRTTGCAWR